MLKRSTSNPRRRVITCAAGLLTGQFRYHLRGLVCDGASAHAIPGCDAGNEDLLAAKCNGPLTPLYFDCRAGCATSRAAALGMLVGRRVNATRNAPIGPISRRDHPDAAQSANHGMQRQLLAANGLPWGSISPRYRYGTLLLANESSRELHVRLRVPRSAESAAQLERAVFEEKRWPARGALAEEHPLYGETPLPVM